MAQLIKLLDFISRYEMNIYRYPSQYIRLKKRNWKKLKELWEEGRLEVIVKETEPKSIERKSFFEPIRNMMINKGRNQVEENKQPMEYKEDNAGQHDEDDRFLLDYQYTDLPKDEDELKRRFLNQLLDFQIRWASSTIREKSFVNREFYDDEHLQYFLQRFPDNYLVLYHPVLLIQKAPVELGVIMISPTEAWCITLLEGKEDGVFYGSKERFWTEKYSTEEKKVLNPLLSSNRMEKIVRNIFRLHSVELPIRKVILNRNGYIDYPHGPADTMFIDKRNYNEWFMALRKLSSPIKHVQLKAAKALLQYCQSTYVKRPDWNQHTNE